MRRRNLLPTPGPESSVRHRFAATLLVVAVGARARAVAQMLVPSRTRVRAMLTPGVPMDSAQRATASCHVPPRVADLLVESIEARGARSGRTANVNTRQLTSHCSEAAVLQPLVLVY